MVRRSVLVAAAITAALLSVSPAHGGHCSTDLSITGGTYRVVEGDPVHVTIQRHGGHNADCSMTAEYGMTGSFGESFPGDTATPDADFHEHHGLLEFGPGVVQRTVTVETIGDDETEGEEQFTFWVARIESSPADTRTIYIEEEDCGLSTVRFASSDYEAVESDEQVVFTLTRSGDVSCPAQVRVTATFQPSDIDPFTVVRQVTLPAGNSQITASVPFGDDDEPQKGTPCTLTLSHPVDVQIGDPWEAGCMVRDDDSAPDQQGDPGSQGSQGSEGTTGSTEQGGTAGSTTAGGDEGGSDGGASTTTAGEADGAHSRHPGGRERDDRPFLIGLMVVGGLVVIGAIGFLAGRTFGKDPGP